jgi:hypothetical protein
MLNITETGDSLKVKGCKEIFVRKNKSLMVFETEKVLNDLTRSFQNDNYISA